MLTPEQLAAAEKVHANTRDIFISGNPLDLIRTLAFQRDALRDRLDAALTGADVWRAYARGIERRGEPCPEWKQLREADALLAQAKGTPESESARAPLVYDVIEAAVALADSVAIADRIVPEHHLATYRAAVAALAEFDKANPQ